MEVILNFLLAVAANVVAGCVSKWLDRQRWGR